MSISDNDKKLFEFKRQMKGHINIKKMKPRDMAMYCQTDQLINNILENSKDQRQKMIQFEKDKKRFKIDKSYNQLYNVLPFLESTVTE